MYTDTVIKQALMNKSESFQRTPCPQFVLQPGDPRDRCVSTPLPCTNIDLVELLRADKVKLKCGGALSMSGQYIWDLARFYCNTLLENINSSLTGQAIRNKYYTLATLCPSFLGIHNASTPDSSGSFGT